ncbi:hypothetical protein H6G81_23490 [Scytonema hofmannii FACHB-248]|uniref:Uncharacterized protein n=1 Tax=Scytonema hofmannii FACHB-248 TaxID=1842502 RepID=A0ABR8GW81_9CYAN|nr:MULTISPECIES: hypothetical protein [Nostocales]MBD2607407.1 hypothetical protein [Scytonema hofmannii FACHB-248]
MTTYTKRIQSRLNRMGIKKSLAEIREVYTSIVNDKDNPTEEEITSVVESFLTAIAAIETASELTTIQSSDEQQSPQPEKVRTYATGTKCGRGFAPPRGNLNQTKHI